MKVTGRQLFLWYFAICCLPLLLIYLSPVGTARVIGWLTGWPGLILAGLVLVGLILYSAGRSREHREKKIELKAERKTIDAIHHSRVHRVDQSP